MSRLSGVARVALALTATPVQAHSPQTGAFGLDPWVVVPLALLLVLFLRGWWQWRRRGRSDRPQARTDHRFGLRALAFAGGWLTLVAALVGPLEALAEQGLAPHMVQHMLLIGVAAPLLVLAWPGPLLLRGMPRSVRAPLARAIYVTRGVWERGGQLAVASLLHAGVIWFWHAPPAFDAALRSRGLHTFEHLSFVLSALLFWWAVRRATLAGEAGAVALWILFTMMHMGLLGALLTFAPEPLYAYHGTMPFGLTALEDQQVAGLVMWVPAGGIYLLAGVVVLGYWLSGVDRQTRWG